MIEAQPSISLGDWLTTPPGTYLLEWEQRHLDEAVVDLFGFHALQLGLPELDGLRSNRMPHRWLAVDTPHQCQSPSTALTTDGRAIALNCDFDALPFDSQSLDLVVLPHSLELARDPHQTLPGGRACVDARGPGG